MYFSCRWQTACPPRHCPTPRAVWQASPAKPNKSLAGEQPRLPAPFIQPKSQTISLQNSFQVYHHLELFLPRRNPPAPSTLTKTSCSSEGARDTGSQESDFFPSFLSPLHFPSELRDSMISEALAKAVLITELWKTEVAPVLSRRRVALSRLLP